MHRHSVEDIHDGLSKFKIAGQNTPLQVIPVKTGEDIKLLSLDSIICIKAESKYSIISTSQKSYISNFSISEIEERLNSPQFARVHRSYIVNLLHVVEFKKHFDKKFRVILDIPLKEDIIVSKNYYDLLKSKIGLP
jgi:two-component system LytT family response regulator